MIGARATSHALTACAVLGGRYAVEGLENACVVGIATSCTLQLALDWRLGGKVCNFL